MAEEKESTEAPVIKLEPESQAEMKKDGTLPLCIGPGCPREALPDSVYCGTDCILQHAAATMKTFSVPKDSKTSGGVQKKPATATASAKVGPFNYFSFFIIIILIFHFSLRIFFILNPSRTVCLTFLLF